MMPIENQTSMYSLDDFIVSLNTYDNPMLDNAIINLLNNVFKRELVKASDDTIVKYCVLFVNGITMINKRRYTLCGDKEKAKTHLYYIVFGHLPKIMSANEIGNHISELQEKVKNQKSNGSLSNTWIAFDAIMNKISSYYAGNSTATI
jgi:hypothetical protein